MIILSDTLIEKSGQIHNTSAFAELLHNNPILGFLIGILMVLSVMIFITLVMQQILNHRRDMENRRLRRLQKRFGNYDCRPPVRQH